ncbi:MAG: S-adenosylmethionine decarboxylase [Gemmatimonadales bacterium]
MTFEHVFADLGGVSADRLSDGQALAGLLLAAANAAGLLPFMPPAVTSGPRGVGVALLCHGGHLALHAVPRDGQCFADVAGPGGGASHPRRGLDVIVKRLGAREIWTDARRRGAPSARATIDPEPS